MIGMAEIRHFRGCQPWSTDSDFTNNWEIFTTVGLGTTSAPGAAIAGAALLAVFPLPLGCIEDLAPGNEDRCSA